MISTRAGAVLVGAVALVALMAPAALAHEGSGTLEVVSAVPGPDQSIAYTVRLTYTADGHPAEGATLTAVAVDAAGTGATPVPLGPTGTPGEYYGTVTFPAPGTWTVRFTAVTPPATLEEPVEIAPPTSSAPTTAGPTTTGAPRTSRPATSSNVTDGVAAGSDEGGTDGAPAGLVAAVVAALALGTGAVVVARRRR